MGSKKSKSWVKEPTLNCQFFADTSFRENHQHVENFQKLKTEGSYDPKNIKELEPKVLDKIKEPPNDTHYFHPWKGTVFDFHTCLWVFQLFVFIFGFVAISCCFNASLASQEGKRRKKKKCNKCLLTSRTHPHETLLPINSK